jgi:hypothetical protein
MTLKNLVSLYQTKVEDEQKEKMLSMNIIDTPPKGFYPYEKAVKVFDPKPGDTIVAMVPVGIILG